MGEIPEWYRTRVAAKSMGVPPWELAKMPLVWQEWELTALEAEHAAEEAKREKRERKYKRGRKR